MKIENLEFCTGCSACYSACPKDAITMMQNNEGFLYPSIDIKKCIKCGICEKTCPVLNSKNNNVNQNRKAFAVINKNEEIRKESSSGGVFTAIAEQIINQKGVVFGAKFTEEFSVVHGWTNSIEGLSAFRGSKYVQSSINNSYREAKCLLDKSRIVLFTGTPCQIAGLRSFLGKDYENLICVDFICHGVPSPLLWKKYVLFQEKKFASQIVKTAFRQKNEGWKLYSLSFTFANDSEYSATLKKDYYMQLFLKNVCLRNSCYNCSFKNFKSNSDVTIGDFWGINNICPEFDDDKGTSFVIVNSKKGGNLFNSILSYCNSKEVLYDEVKKYNPSLYTSVKKTSKRKKFYSELNKLPFDKLARKYTKESLYQKIKIFMKRCFRKAKSILFKK